MKALIGAGTNIGNREENLQNAVRAFSLIPGTRVTRISGVYETEPWGYTDQPDFFNIVFEVETSLSPYALLGACLGIEAAMGRVRQFKNGPRNVDLDVLLYENETSGTPELTLPHPRMGERAFVLVPLKELYPDGRALGFDFSAQSANVDTSGVILTDYKITSGDEND